MRGQRAPWEFDPSRKEVSAGFFSLTASRSELEFLSILRKGPTEDRNGFQKEVHHHRTLLDQPQFKRPPPPEPPPQPVCNLCALENEGNTTGREY
mmetsp:Transcript_34865/g.137761  ORF Transcript_34865/g.137761 Transcript_34865/m.137761 type:complete len:95 (-) Transcript_34865:4690-4974(-)